MCFSSSVRDNLSTPFGGGVATYPVGELRERTAELAFQMRLSQVRSSFSASLYRYVRLTVYLSRNLALLGGGRGVFEIVFRVQIGNQPRLNRSPSKPFLCLRAGSRTVHTKEGSDPAKMIGCFLTRLAHDRNV